MLLRHCPVVLSKASGGKLGTDEGRMRHAGTGRHLPEEGRTSGTGFRCAISWRALQHMGLG